MEALALAAVVAAYIVAYVASITFPLVVMPWILDRRGVLPYNSVRSRVLAWASFAALMSAISALGPTGPVFANLETWAGLLALIGIAAGIDLWDLRTRRIPRGRHPDA